MKTSRYASMLLLSGITAFGSLASASDELAGALIGAGTGAVIGNAIDRYDGAVVGGILGAVIGVAIADNDNDRRPAHVHYGYSWPQHRPAPVMIYQPPRVRYVTQPVYVTQHHYVKTYSAPYYWKHDRFDRRDHRDNRWDRGNDRRHDGRHDRDDRDDRDYRRNW